MKALVLAGGGSKGAYEVGAIKALSSMPEYANGFEFISGSSVGALNAAILASYKPNQLSDAADLLKYVWSKKMRKIWKLKFPPYISGLWSTSIGSIKDLESLVDTYVDIDEIRTSGISLHLPSVNLRTGSLHICSEKTEHLREGILASASIPVLFPPRNIYGDLHVDGCVRDVAPLSAAIKSGADEIVIILTSNPHSMEEVTKYKSVFDVLSRSFEILLNELFVNDISICKKINRDISKYPGKRAIDLKVLYPQKKLGSPLDFSKELVTAQIALGYNDTVAFYKDKK